MPHLDVIDELNRAKSELLRKIDKHAGKRGASLLAEAVVEEFDALVSHVDDERREWESVINLLMDRENEEEDKRV
jgi:hypothetical protein